ncbi:hypothetical protein EB001_06985 [bacterium]|nr:hypothetical protein [bacterium]
MNLIERIKSPRPNFWVKVGTIGVALSVVGTAIMAPLPAVGGVLLTIGATAKALSHLAVE